MQPAYLPRPDLEALNVSYRRIPLLSHGKDMYCDTRLILKKLEGAFPEGALGASTPEHLALERLLERYTTDAGIFVRAVQLMPTDMPALQDPKFIEDRNQFSGRSGGFNKEAVARARPEAVAHMRDAFELVESTFFKDGREWIFGTAKPSLGDIEGMVILHGERR
jgi:glutathione S-transferase